MACCGWRAFRHGKEVGARSGLTPTPSARGNTADARGIATAGTSPVRAMAMELAWGWRRCQPARALPPWYQQRGGHGRSRRRRRGLVALARKRRMAVWRVVEAGVLPDGAALKAAVPLSQPRRDRGATGLGWAAREETGFAVRTEREQGRPATALSRRHERMRDQGFGGKTPTRREGRWRRIRLTPSRALSTVATRRGRVVCSRGAIAQPGEMREKA